MWEGEGGGGQMGETPRSSLNKDMIYIFFFCCKANHLNFFRTEELSLQKHEQTVVLHTTEACWDVSQGFRCKVKK